MISFQRIWNTLMPKKAILYIRFLMEPKSYKERRKAVLNHFKSKPNLPADIKESLRYLKCHKYTAFPYNWSEKYEFLMPEVFEDTAKKRFYAKYEGKNLYYPEYFTREQVVWGIRSILKEQDPHSAHLYLTNNFQVEPGSIIVDGGVAEGNFALSVVEKCKKLYLIECDPEWLSTLKVTFEPWKDKVVFVEKFLSDVNDSTSVTIDALVEPDEKENYFIKMDIEGYEKKALVGMERLMTTCKNVKMDICTYHHPNDVTEIGAIISKHGFEYEVSEGHILYFHPGEEPSFRKALIRAKKY